MTDRRDFVGDFVETNWTSPPVLDLALPSEDASETSNKSPSIYFGWRFRSSSPDGFNAGAAVQLANKLFAVYMTSTQSFHQKLFVDIFDKWVNHPISVYTKESSTVLAYFAAAPMAVDSGNERTLRLPAALQDSGVFLTRLIEVHIAISQRVKQHEGVMAKQRIPTREMTVEFTMQPDYDARFLIFDQANESQAWLVGTAGWWAKQHDVKVAEMLVRDDIRGWKVASLSLDYAVKLILDSAVENRLTNDATTAS